MVTPPELFTRLRDTIMSTITVEKKDNPKKLPETVALYKSTKYGVDIGDHVTRKYSVRKYSGLFPQSSIKYGPEVFNGIHLKRLTWPWKSLDPISVLPFFGHFLQCGMELHLL